MQLPNIHRLSCAGQSCPAHGPHSNVKGCQVKSLRQAVLTGLTHHPNTNKQQVWYATTQYEQQPSPVDSGPPNLLRTPLCVQTSCRPSQHGSIHPTILSYCKQRTHSACKMSQGAETAFATQNWCTHCLKQRGDLEVRTPAPSRPDVLHMDIQYCAPGHAARHAHSRCRHIAAPH